MLPPAAEETASNKNQCSEGSTNIDGSGDESSLDFSQVRKSLMQLRCTLASGESQEHRHELTPAMELQFLTQRLENIEAALASSAVELSPQSLEVIRLHSRIDQLEKLCLSSISAADMLKVRFEEKLSALRLEIMGGLPYSHYDDYNLGDAMYEVPEQLFPAPRSKSRDSEALLSLCRSRLSFREHSLDAFRENASDSERSQVVYHKSQLTQNMDRLQKELSEDLSEKFQEAHILMKATWENKIAEVLEQLQDNTGCGNSRLLSTPSCSSMEGLITPDENATPSSGHATARDVAKEVHAIAPRSSPLHSVSARKMRVSPANLPCTKPESIPFE
jgi:hypothetical protein